MLARCYNARFGALRARAARAEWRLRRRWRLRRQPYHYYYYYYNYYNYYSMWGTSCDNMSHDVKTCSRRAPHLMSHVVT